MERQRKETYLNWRYVSAAKSHEIWLKVMYSDIGLHTAEKHSLHINESRI